MRSNRLRTGFVVVSNGLRGRAAGALGMSVKLMGCPLALAPSYSRIAAFADDKSS